MTNSALCCTGLYILNKVEQYPSKSCFDAKCKQFRYPNLRFWKKTFFNITEEFAMEKTNSPHIFRFYWKDFFIL